MHIPTLFPHSLPSFPAAPLALSPGKPLISLLPFPGVRVIGLTTQAATVSVPCTLSLAALLWAGPTLLADEGCPQCATCHQLWHSCGYCKTLGGFPSPLGTGLSFPSPVMLCAGKRAGEPIPRYSFYFCDVCLPLMTLICLKSCRMSLLILSFKNNF